MTVKELIEKLSKIENKDQEIIINLNKKVKGHYKEVCGDIEDVQDSGIDEFVLLQGGIDYVVGNTNNLRIE